MKAQRLLDCCFFLLLRRRRCLLDLERDRWRVYPLASTWGEGLVVRPGRRATVDEGCGTAGAGGAESSLREAGGPEGVGTAGVGFGAGLRSGLTFLGGVPTAADGLRGRVGVLTRVLLRVRRRGGEVIVG